MAQLALVVLTVLTLSQQEPGFDDNEASHLDKPVVLFSEFYM